MGKASAAGPAKVMLGGKLQTLTEYLAPVRQLAWAYFAPRCVACGFDRHYSAIDMHHIDPRQKEEHVGRLINRLGRRPKLPFVQSLVAEASKCAAICSNCHRMLHMGIIQLPEGCQPLPYSAEELMEKLWALSAN